MNNKSNSAEEVMPWGKYKGKYIHSLPSDYLRWVAENADWDTATQELCDEEYQFRENTGTHKWGD